MDQHQHWSCGGGYRGWSGKVIPEHNLEVWYAGAAPVLLASSSTSRQQDWLIEATVPEGLLQVGNNPIELRMTTQYKFSLMVLDRYGVRYPSPYVGPVLDFPPDLNADGYLIDGYAESSAAAYAVGGDGSLSWIEPVFVPSQSGFAAMLPRIESGRVWVSDSPHQPDVFTTAIPAELIDEPGDLVVITDASFIDTPALNEYLLHKAEYNPVVVDVEDVFNAYGYGMAVPSAITDYLKARDDVYPFSHVQLVGADCYDRRNYISSCASYVPLPTAPIGVTIYSPSHNRLVDFDADSVSDVAVGQFSVRDADELATIVQKGTDWNGGIAGAQSALLIAEEIDNSENDFAAQIDRINALLNWNATDVIDLADHMDNIQTARTAMDDSLSTGRTLTVFSGHASPTVWAYRSLLTASTAADLTNVGNPTMLLPMSCQTSYDFSPNAVVLGHKLLYSGPQGAVAISGGVSLTSLSDNETMVGHIVNGMKAGLTLGEAVQAGRAAIGTDNQTLLDNWLTQGDATLKLIQ